MPNDLRSLASHASILTTYTDVWGNRRSASDETLVAILNQRGIPAASAAETSDSLQRLYAIHAESFVEPVVVAWNGIARVPLRGVDSATIECELRLENDDSRIQIYELSTSTLPSPRGGRDPRARVVSFGQLPFGYHALSIRAGTREAKTTILSAPRQVWKGQGRGFGFFAPLYSFRSARNWGIGDIADAEQFLAWAELNGTGFLGILPTLPAYLDEPLEPSPYAPVSRLFWNEIFVDVGRIPELAIDPAARELLESSGFRAELESLRALDLIDYQRVYAAKRRIFDSLARTFHTRGSDERREAFEKFRASTPLLADYARFRGATEREQTGFRFWRDPKGADGESDASRQHEYVQFIAEEQIAALAGSRASGLYLDFPLGTNRDGFDVWRFPQLFAKNAAIGAPPDFSYGTGQNWGFPPLDPDAIREDGYRYFAACIRHHVRHAGMLRLDHVMSLHRTFWIPDGFEAKDGAYVRYEADEFYAVLAIESHRAKTRIIGEDLGTVPMYVREAIDRRGLHRLFVLQRQLTHAGDPPGTIVPNMVASLNNHDMPPFAGFWKERDIDERLELHLIDARRAAEMREKREHARLLLIGFLRGEGLLTGDTSLETIIAASNRWLARSSAEIVLLSLEDLWAETESQNLPTTTTERPNWRRKFAIGIEEIVQSKEFASALESIRNARG
ncbi:MAG: 4-alpha-glucanotransferase [Thermoanaerobaculia bacterium]